MPRSDFKLNMKLLKNLSFNLIELKDPGLSADKQCIFMNIFDYENYKIYLKKRIQEMPRRGRGTSQKLASFLQIQPSHLSQVFNGSVDLSLEQAQKVTEYFEMRESESEYFLTLVSFARAGTKKLRDHYLKSIQKQQSLSHKLMNRVMYDRILDEKSQAQFYSQWYYSAIRLLTSIPEFQNPDRIADHLGLPIKTVNIVVDFLLQMGLCQRKDDILTMGDARTFIASDSPHVHRHHGNWRLKCLAQIENLGGDELMYTNPVTIAKADFPRVRAKIVELITEFSEIVKESPAEELALLNIDWVRIRPQSR